LDVEGEVHIEEGVDDHLVQDEWRPLMVRCKDGGSLEKFGSEFPFFSSFASTLVSVPGVQTPKRIRCDQSVGQRVELGMVVEEALRKCRGEASSREGRKLSREGLP
jgi:hypothetical protein